MYKVALFDSFAYCCPFFTSETEVNNGYGCTHPEQECVQERGGEKLGCCFDSSCPIGITPDEEDRRNPDIDWDGLCEDGDVGEGEYIMVNTGPGASEQENEAWDAYERYMNRYNPSWHGHQK